MREERYPSKLSLGCFPTPLQKLERVSAILGEGRSLWLKRDDLCGMAFGGNKVRKLEYIFANAVEKGCDCVVTAGGSTSNQTVAVAACAAMAGLEAHIVIPETTRAVTRGLLAYTMAQVHEVGSGAELTKGIHGVMRELKAAGRHPYEIPVGASTVLGVIGYADGVRELRDQAEKLGLSIDHLVCVGGSGNTYAGLLLGAKLYLPDTKVTVVSIARRFTRPETLCRRAEEGAALLGVETEVDPAEVHIHFCSGKGLDDPTPKGKQAMKFLLREEGIFLDPIYTGKGFAGLMELWEQGCFAPGETVVFLYSGGTVSLMNQL